MWSIDGTGIQKGKVKLVTMWTAWGIDNEGLLKWSFIFPEGGDFETCLKKIVEGTILQEYVKRVTQQWLLTYQCYSYMKFAKQ